VIYGFNSMAFILRFFWCSVRLFGLFNFFILVLFFQSAQAEQAAFPFDSSHQSVLDSAGSDADLVSIIQTGIDSFKVSDTSNLHQIFSFSTGSFLIGDIVGFGKTPDSFLSASASQFGFVSEGLFSSAISFSTPVLFGILFFGDNPVILDIISNTQIPLSAFSSHQGIKFLITANPLSVVDTQGRKNQFDIIKSRTPNSTYNPLLISHAVYTSYDKVYFGDAVSSPFSRGLFYSAADFSTEMSALSNKYLLDYISSLYSNIYSREFYNDNLGRNCIRYEISDGPQNACMQQITAYPFEDPNNKCPQGTGFNANGYCYVDFTKDEVSNLYALIGYSPDYELWADGSIHESPRKYFNITSNSPVPAKSLLLFDESAQTLSLSISDIDFKNDYVISYDNTASQLVLKRTISNVSFFRGDVKADIQKYDAQSKITANFNYLVNYDSAAYSFISSVSSSYSTSDNHPFIPAVDSLAVWSLKPQGESLVKQFNILDFVSDSPDPLQKITCGLPEIKDESGKVTQEATPPCCGLPEIKDESGKVIQEATSACVVDWGKPLKSENEGEEQEPEPPSADDFKKAIFGEEFLNILKGQIFSQSDECPVFSFDSSPDKIVDFSDLVIDGHCRVLETTIPYTSLTVFELSRLILSLIYLLYSLRFLLDA